MMMQIDRQEAYKLGQIPYCQWCVEAGDWDNHSEHDLVEEVHHEQIVYHHVEMIAFNGECSRCHMQSDEPGLGCRA
jgi:hypothetical protein